MIDFTPYIDSHQIIVQADLDGGDSLNRLGLYYYGAKLQYPNVYVDYLGKDLRIGFEENLNKHSVGPGQYVRHPDKTKWYSKLNKTSRDQLIPVIIAMGHYGLRSKLKELFVFLISRLGFSTNTSTNGDHNDWKIPDIFMPQHYGVFIRAFNYSILYPILLVTDTFLIIDVTIHTIKSYIYRDFHDDLNLTVMLIQSDVTMPTPLSKLAKKILRKRYRSIHNAWLNYFSKESGAPPFFDFYLTILYYHF